MARAPWWHLFNPLLGGLARDAFTLHWSRIVWRYSWWAFWSQFWKICKVRASKARVTEADLFLSPSELVNPGVPQNPWLCPSCLKKTATPASLTFRMVSTANICDFANICLVFKATDQYVRARHLDPSLQNENCCAQWKRYAVSVLETLELVCAQPWLPSRGHWGTNIICHRHVCRLFTAVARKQDCNAISNLQLINTWSWLNDLECAKNLTISSCATEQQENESNIQFLVRGSINFKTTFVNCCLENGILLRLCYVRRLCTQFMAPTLCK